MKFIDICAGIGGFRLGLEMAGHECIGFVEYDKYAVKSYRAMHNTEGEFYHDDITTIKSEDIPYADTWCFGFPCQDISIAGKQKGMDGNRSGIYFDIIDLIKGKKEEDKPRWLLIENVKNLFSIDGGRGFARVLAELDEAGYDAEWSLLNSKNFGVPHNRERVFIVGHLRGRSRGEVFPIARSCEPTEIKVIGTTAPECRTIGQRDVVYGTNGIMSCLTATDYKQPKQIRVKQLGNISELNIPGVMVIDDTQGFDGVRYYDDEVPTLRSQRSGLKVLVGKIQPKNRDYNKLGEKREEVIEYRKDDVAPSCMAGVNTTVVNTGYRIRKLTPKECFRLQGFPDEYFEKAASVNSNSQLYKQAGNGVTVNVTFEIGKKIAEIESLQIAV